MHHFSSGKMKGAMNAPLAPSMWILISHPCFSLSLPARRAAAYLY